MVLSAGYANDHRNPNGPGDARPTALKIIRDQGLDGELLGKVFFVTGCTSGIGVETARALHVTGADVYFTGRDKEAGRDLVERLTKDGKPGKVVFMELDLTSLASVQDTASKFRGMSDKLNGLICNAGVAFHPKAKTVDGFETHFGVNHIAHFALFQSLKDLLLKSATSEFPSRVTMVSSHGHTLSPLNLDDYNIDQGEFDPFAAYGASKTANIWMANEIERQYGARHLHANSLHPGAIFTRAGRHLSDGGLSITQSPEIAPKMKSLEQGASTTVWAAVAKELRDRGGLYLNDVQEGVPMSETDDVEMGYAAYAFDEKSEKRLWELSLELLRGKFSFSEQSFEN